MDPSHAKISLATSASQQFSRNLPKPVSDPFVEPQGSVAADPGSQKRARLLSPRVQPQTKASMAEPPAKRARRTDSAAMWDGNHRDAKAPEREPKDHKGRGSERDRGGRRDGTRTHGREDRRHRSRSGGGGDRRRLRSRSRDRGETRSRGGERDNKEGREGRERRDRERTASRERHRSRRGETKLIRLHYGC